MLPAMTNGIGETCGITSQFDVPGQSGSSCSYSLCYPGRGLVVAVKEEEVCCVHEDAQEAEEAHGNVTSSGLELRWSNELSWCSEKWGDQGSSYLGWGL